MTFSDHPDLQMIPEWKKQYMSYETLKSLLNKEDRLNLICYANSQKSVTKEFFKSCEEELNKVNLFFSEKLSEAHNRLATFGIVAQEVSGYKVQGDNRVISVFQPTKRRRTNLKQIKMAVAELYLSLAFLQKYQEFNYKYFCKITIMYDSKSGCEHGLKWRNGRLDTSLLNTDRGKCEHLMSKLETFMIQLEGGDKLREMKRLAVPPIDKTPNKGQIH